MCYVSAMERLVGSGVEDLAKFGAEVASGVSLEVGIKKLLSLSNVLFFITLATMYFHSS